MSFPPSSSNVTDRSEQLHAIGRNNFDFCRFWLAILVIFSHSYPLAEGTEAHEPFHLATNGQLTGGAIAVNGFFAISGYLIAYSWLRSRSVGGFLSKRVFRIYPGFIAAVLIGVFIIAPLGADQLQLSSQFLRLLPLKLLTLNRAEPPGVFAANPFPDAINGSLWSIPYEFKCYLGIMLLGALSWLTRWKAMTAYACGAVIAGSLAYPWMTLSVLERGSFAATVGSASNWFNVLPHFLVGTTFYLFRDRVRFSGRWAACAALAVAVAGLFPPLGRAVYPPAATYLLFWFAFHPAVPLQKWSRYGDFSYGIYLYAFPIQQLLVQSLPGLSPVALFLAAAPLSIIAGAISWHLIEKHFLRAAHRRTELSRPNAEGISSRPIESPLLEPPLSTLEG